MKHEIFEHIKSQLKPDSVVVEKTIEKIVDHKQKQPTSHTNKRLQWALLLVVTIGLVVGLIRILPAQNVSEEPTLSEVYLGLETTDFELMQADFSANYAGISDFSALRKMSSIFPVTYVMVKAKSVQTLDVSLDDTTFFDEAWQYQVDVLEATQLSLVGTTIDVRQFLQGADDQGNNNLMRIGGVYILQLSKYESYYFNPSEYTLLFESDHQGKIHTHSSEPDFKKYNGLDLMDFWNNFKIIGLETTDFNLSSIADFALFEGVSSLDDLKRKALDEEYSYVLVKALDAETTTTDLGYPFDKVWTYQVEVLDATKSSLVGETIQVTQNLLAESENGENNLMRTDGVYILQVSSIEDQYQNEYDYTHLFEVDQLNLVHTHSSVPEIQKYNGQSVSDFWKLLTSKGLEVSDFELEQTNFNALIDYVGILEIEDLVKHYKGEFEVVQALSIEDTTVSENYEKSIFVEVEVLNATDTQRIGQKMKVFQNLAAVASTGENNFMRIGGVYVLQIYEDDGVFTNSNEYTLLFEKDLYGKMHTHSSQPGINQYNGMDIDSFWELITQVYSEN